MTDPESAGLPGHQDGARDSGYPADHLPEPGFGVASSGAREYSDSAEGSPGAPNGHVGDPEADTAEPVVRDEDLDPLRAGNTSDLSFPMQATGGNGAPKTQETLPEPVAQVMSPSTPVGIVPSPGGTSVSADQEPEHDGSGLSVRQEVESNQGTMIGVLQQTVRRMIDSHELTPRYIADCMRTFAEPGNFAEAVDKLSRGRVVVLTGPRGCGRHTSAVRLLERFAGLNLHEVRRQLGDNFEIEDIVAEDHAGWLLDLRDDDDKVQESLGRMLVASSSRILLESVSSYLTVVIREDLWAASGIGGDDVLIRLAHARAKDIVELRLTKDSPSISEDETAAWLNDSDIDASIAELPPSEAVEWAEAIRAEHFTPLPPDSIQPGETVEEILKKKVRNVLAARRDWRDQLLKWHTDHSDIGERGFLLAAAVLENMPAEQVFTGSRRLTKALGSDDQQASGLAGPGIIQLTSRIEADLSHQETIHFKRAGYSDAVLEYFWTDRMPLREAFIRWLSTDKALTGQGKDAEAVLERIGQYVLRWSIRRNKLDLMEPVITAWAETGKLVQAAENLMTAAGLDANLGKSMRDRMLTWAKPDQGSIPVKLVVARACGGPLGKMYPSIMLYRIGYLAGIPDPKISAEVKDAVRSMWDNTGVRERIRKEIMAWYSSDNEARRTAARNSFAAIAGLVDDSYFPIALQPDRGGWRQPPMAGTEDFLVRGWRCIFDKPQPSEDCANSFSAWMDAAIRSEQAQVAVYNIFASAVYSQLDDTFSDRRYTTLSHLLYRWEPANRHPGERAELRDAFLETILRLDRLRYPPREAYLSGG
jgi:hypothetical protein